eukprot:6180376-Pleurochrysis_carterae.AAC.4
MPSRRHEWPLAWSLVGVQPVCNQSLYHINLKLNRWSLLTYNNQAAHMYNIMFDSFNDRTRQRFKRVVISFVDA